MYDLELSAKGVTVKLNAAFVGKDLLVWLTGGQAHIGAVALAVPRPSLRDDDKVSADATVMTVGGHKEDLLARKIALALATKLNVQVCVSAGLHWDSATPTRIETAKELSGRLTKTLLMHITKAKDGKTAQTEPAENKPAAADATEAPATVPETPAMPTPKVAPQARPTAKPTAPAPRPAPAGTRPAQGVTRPPGTPVPTRPATPAARTATPARPAAPPRPAVKNADGSVTTPEGIIIDVADETTPATPAARPAAPKPQGTVTRDAQGRPVSVRQAVNATLKKPLLSKQ